MPHGAYTLSWVNVNKLHVASFFTKTFNIIYETIVFFFVTDGHSLKTSNLKCNLKACKERKQLRMEYLETFFIPDTV